MQSRYAIVSPVKDEARYIEQTLRSVTRQTVPPVRWVIVDDGSSDSTPDLVREYAQKHSFIRLLTCDRAHPRMTGTAEAQAFQRGYTALGGVEYDFIVKLDGDLNFEPDYFERLLIHFAADARLGIASGVYLERDAAGTWQRVEMPAYHAFGASKVVRRQCFEQIGGFLTRPGWDTVDEIRAWTFGWTTRHFPELEVQHLKPEGTASGLLTTSAMHGEIYYVTGGDPWLLPFKLLRRLSARPFVLNALALAYGYCAARLRQRPRLVTSDEARRYRQLLRQRLFGAWTRLPAISSAER
jgi:biofilm PGA synthesis N-glycosyltransferase PgaC